MPSRLNLQSGVFFVAILLSSLLGWFLIENTLVNHQNELKIQNWVLPTPENKNLTLYNQQLTKLNIWGQQKMTHATARASLPWKLVGISRANGTLVALIEIKGEISLQRIKAGQIIVANTKILSISKESIHVETNGQDKKIPLYL